MYENRFVRVGSGPKSTEQQKADNRRIRAIASITPSMMVTLMDNPYHWTILGLTTPSRGEIKTAMSTWQSISDHYTHGGLLEAIHRGVTTLGKTADSVTVDDLAPVDEFHIGGRQASEDFLEQLNLNPDTHILDVGCGLGGTTRFVASRYGARVTGIDLTDEYIETGQTLCQWVGLDDRIELQQGNALAMRLEDAIFDGAYTMHVGMNIEDKAAFYANVYRVLRPGAWFGIYDIMRSKDGELTYPLPWATQAEASFVVTPQHYQDALQAAGFRIVNQRKRGDLALKFFAQMRATATAGNPPPLGLHVLMGDHAMTKLQNMIHHITFGTIEPVELIAQKAE